MAAQTLPTPRFSGALRQHPAAELLSQQTLHRTLAGSWPGRVQLLWQYPDLLALFLHDALDAAHVQVRDELFDEILAAIQQQKGTPI